MNTTANKITLFRMILVPVFLALAYAGFNYAAFACFAVACLSDMIDGYIARHYNQITNFGKFMDPLADKILVLAAMCLFLEKGRMPGWAVALVLFREFAVSGLRLIAAEQNRVIAAAKSGKIKTICTMVGLCAMLLFPGIAALDTGVTWVILLTTLWSGIEYFAVNRDVFKEPTE